MATSHNNEFQGLARTCALYANHRSVGISPLRPFTNPCIYTRFLTEEDKRKQQSLARCESKVLQLKSVTERCKRRETNLRVGRNLCLFVNRIVFENLKAKNRQLRSKAEEWKADATKYGAEIVRVSWKTEKLEKELDDALEQVTRVKKEREDIISVLLLERQKAEAAENYRRVAISSLHSRWSSQKVEMEEEIKLLRDKLYSQRRKMEGENNLLREMIGEQEDEISKIETFADESDRHIEALQRTIAMYENEEMMAAVSERLSNVISDIGEIAMVRPDEEQSVPEKIRDIRDYVKDFVKELKSRRRNAEISAERVFQLEEERSLWETNQKRYEAEKARLNESLLAASREIARLRKGEQEERPQVENKSHGNGVGTGSLLFRRFLKL